MTVGRWDNSSHARPIVVWSMEAGRGTDLFSQNKNLPNCGHWKDFERACLLSSQTVFPSRMGLTNELPSLRNNISETILEYLAWLIFCFCFSAWKLESSRFFFATCFILECNDTYLRHIHTQSGPSRIPSRIVTTSRSDGHLLSLETAATGRVGREAGDPIPPTSRASRC